MTPAYRLTATPQRVLYDSLAVKTFVRLDTLRSLDIKHVTVLYKTRPAVSGMTIDAVSVVELPFGEIETLTCGGILVGYELKMPKCRLQLGANYVTFALRDKLATRDVVKYVDTRDLVVIGNAQALLAVSNRRYWTTG